MRRWSLVAANATTGFLLRGILTPATTTLCVAMSTSSDHVPPVAPSSSSSSSSSSSRFRSWPITSARSVEPELRRMGLRISADRIDGTSNGDGNGDGSSGALSDALVSVGPAGRGGTGSFVSDDGLILTNWHVAYDAVRQASIAASSDGTDYVRDGYVARTRGDEIRGPNYEVWITRSCADVSDRVLDVIESVSDPLERANRVRDRTQEIAREAQERATSASADGNGGGGLRCDVQEMLPNESYVLFTYERLRDVRIVYVPPKSLGNFGGDTDNFEWPRHTADFTLLRAYVGPDGEAAEYDPRNVPYKPRTRLQIQSDGAKEGDMVFLLGFPGSTMRYAPSARLRYSDGVATPRMVDDFARKLDLIAEHETASADAAMKMGGSKKSLANNLKRNRGKLVMMRKLGLIAEREEEERALVEADPESAPRILRRIGEIYDQLRSREPESSALDAMRGIYAGSALLAAGHAAHEFLRVEKAKPDGERESSYRGRNLPFLADRLAKRLGDVHVPHEAALVEDAVEKLPAAVFYGGSGGSSPLLSGLRGKVASVFKEEEGGIFAAVVGSELRKLDGAALRKAMSDADDEADATLPSPLSEDPFVLTAAALYGAYEADRDRTRALLSERDALFAALLELQRTAAPPGQVFYPDCNGSLRLSAGRVEGYSPTDAVTHDPKTTLAGLFEKAADARLSDGGGSPPGDYDCPDRLYDLLSSSSSAGDVPVCLLYSTDTVGGNSGSPVMNRDGEFVAINFDRQRQGLMNEFKWSQRYSRSIGVDVRYILWLVGEYDGAADLVKEILT